MLAKDNPVNDSLKISLDVIGQKNHSQNYQYLCF